MPGDEAILLSPSWASYEPMLEFIGAVPVHVNVKMDSFHPDLEAIREAVTEKTKISHKFSMQSNWSRIHS